MFSALRNARFIPTHSLAKKFTKPFSVARKIEEILPDRPQTTIGRYLAQRLVQAGLQHYFTVPGDFTLSLLDEFLKEDSLTMVGCCNELNAGYAADGYARATGGISAVMVTYMVGGLSTINAVAGAYSDDLPVICISGGPNYVDAQERNIIHHTIGERDIYQQSECFKPIVAKSFVIRHPREAAQMIDEAILTALTRRKPVYLELAVNLSLYPIAAPTPISLAPDHPRPASDFASLDAVVEDILHGIEGSVKPVLIAGSKLGRKTNTVDEFLRVAETLDCALAIMPDAKGLIPENHRNFVGKYWGTVSDHHVAEIVESADLVIMAGAVLNDYTTVGWSALLPPNKLLLIEPDGVRFGPNYYPNVQMKDVLSAIADRATSRPGSMQTYRRYTEGKATETLENLVGGTENLSLRFLKSTIEKSLTSDTTLVVETGDSWFIGQSLKLPEGAKYNVQMQYGSIGWSVGALLGTALAEGQTRRVLALIGDGSFQLTAQEVSTMIRYNVKATIILLNNDGYTIEVQIHDGAYNDIKNWDYAGLIEVFNAGNGNGLGLKAHTCEEFTQALAKSETHDGVCLIECFLGRDDCTAELLEWGSRVCKANGRR